MSTEVQEAKKWVSTLLRADVTIQGLLGTQPTRVYVDHASRELGFPYILINHMSSRDTPGLGTNRELTRADLQVRVVSEGPPDSTALAAGARLDALLQVQVKAPFGGFYFSSRRIMEVDRPEYDKSEKRYHNTGGIYRAWISKTP